MCFILYTRGWPALRAGSCYKIYLFYINLFNFMKHFKNHDRLNDMIVIISKQIINKILESCCCF